jgi:hypothetical protein
MASRRRRASLRRRRRNPAGGFIPAAGGFFLAPLATFYVGRAVADAVSPPKDAIGSYDNMPGMATYFLAALGFWAGASAVKDPGARSFLIGSAWGCAFSALLVPLVAFMFGAVAVAANVTPGAPLRSRYREGDRVRFRFPNSAQLQEGEIIGVEVSADGSRYVIDMPDSALHATVTEGQIVEVLPSLRGFDAYALGSG